MGVRPTEFNRNKDARIRRSGPRRPGNTFPAGPTTGDLFYKTDARILWVWDGSSWGIINGVGDTRILNGGATLADLDAASTFQGWGSPIVIPNPGVPVTVTALLTGQVVSSDSSLNEYIVSISFDGGDSFMDGLVVSSKGSAANQHVHTDAPTGDIHIQAQGRSDSTDAQFSSGTITYLMVPN